MSSDELIEPITPSHLLCGRRIATLPDQPTEDEDENLRIQETRLPGE